MFISNIFLIIILQSLNNLSVGGNAFEDKLSMIVISYSKLFHFSTQ